MTENQTTTPTPASTVRARVSTAGVFRCCFSAIPIDDEGYAVAGEDGAAYPCAYCEDGGFTYDAVDNIYWPTWVWKQKQADLEIEGETA